MLENSGHDIGDSPNGDKIVPNEVAFYLAIKTVSANLNLSG